MASVTGISFLKIFLPSHIVVNGGRSGGRAGALCLGPGCLSAGSFTNWYVGLQVLGEVLRQFLMKILIKNFPSGI